MKPRSSHAATFPESKVAAVHRADDSRSGKQAMVLDGGLHRVWVSFHGRDSTGARVQAASVPIRNCAGEAESRSSIGTDRREWREESACGSCTGSLGLNCKQITPRVLTEALAAGGAEAKRAFDAMMTMRKSTSPRSSRRPNR